MKEAMMKIIEEILAEAFEKGFRATNRVSKIAFSRFLEMALSI